MRVVKGSPDWGAGGSRSGAVHERWLGATGGVGGRHPTSGGGAHEGCGGGGSGGGGGRGHRQWAWRGGGGVATRPWWLALLACGGAYWPLALEPSAMTSRHPYYCGHPYYRGHPHCRGGGESRMHLLPMASSLDGLTSARVMRSSQRPPDWGVLTTTRNVNVTQGHGC